MLYFGMKLLQDGDNELWSEEIWLNPSKGHCQGQKGQVWLIVTYFSILISSIEVLPKCIAPCSFSEVILVLFSNIKGVDWFWRLFSRSEWSNLDLCYLYDHIWPFSLSCNIWFLMKLKGQMKVIGFSAVIFHKLSTFWP